MLRPMLMLHKVIKNIKNLGRTYDTSTLPDGIYSVNYHRIGDLSKTAFDSNVFSSSVKSFDNQLVFYKEIFNVITAKEASGLIESEKELTAKFLVITFDDGYADNYTKAYPILLKHNLFATFFIATDYIGSGKIPWWDKVAYIIKQTKLDSIKIGKLHPKEIKLNDKAKATRQILKLFKTSKEIPIYEKLHLLQLAANIGDEIITDDINDPLFMNWKMITEMADNGMDIGSHTCSHQILSHLSEIEQNNEFTKSKKIIEDKIKSEVVALAYPVGAYTSYNFASSIGVKNAGYKIAFDFEKGINTSPLKCRKFQLHRFPINYDHNLQDIIKMFILNGQI